VRGQPDRTHDALPGDCLVAHGLCPPTYLLQTKECQFCVVEKCFILPGCLLLRYIWYLDHLSNLDALGLASHRRMLQTEWNELGVAELPHRDDLWCFSRPSLGGRSGLRLLGGSAVPMGTV